MFDEKNQGDVNHKEHSDELNENNALRDHIIVSELETSEPQNTLNPWGEIIPINNVKRKPELSRVKLIKSCFKNKKIKIFILTDTFKKKTSKIFL